MVERHQVAQAMTAKDGHSKQHAMTGSRRTDTSQWLGIIGLLLSSLFILALIIR
jgi:hypothetical protein